MRETHESERLSRWEEAPKLEGRLPKCQEREVCKLSRGVRAEKTDVKAGDRGVRARRERCQ